LGYQIFQDRQIPVITLEQRESLIALARSLNEKIKIVEPPPLTNKENDYYEEDPFTAFNNSAEAGRILLDNGWKDGGHNNTHRYYTRPGRDKGISASFNVSSRIFYVFTTSTQLEHERGYHPATVLSILQFMGSKKETYRYLVERGYGRIRPGVELSMVKSKAITGADLPANASPGAKVLYLETRTQLQQKYPHGLFWEISDKEVVTINREKLYQVARDLGFRSYNQDIVQVVGYTVKRTVIRSFYDQMKAYVGENEDVCNGLEAFLQRSGEFTTSRIELLDITKLLVSTRDTSYKFYQNTYIAVTADAMELLPYNGIADQLIWESQILPRPFEFALIDSKALYYSYLDLAVGISSYLFKIIGYLAHEHRDESAAYFIMLTEQCPDPKHGGGTGKNIFCNLIGCCTTLKNLAGSQLQLNEKFLQAWNYEQVLAIHDLPKRFNFGFFKEPTGGSATLKKLYKNEESLPASVMPKFIFTTNYSYDDSDGGVKRRIRPLEFSAFFTRAGGVDKHYGKMFPHDWSATDWLQYDNVMLKAIQHYLQDGGKLEPNPLTEDGWLKKFDQMHMVLTREFIQQREQYMKFSTANNIDRKYQLSSMRMTQALEDWCTHYKIVYLNNHVKRQLLDTERGRLFEKTEAPF
jgi:hypothetical protein